MLEERLEEKIDFYNRPQFVNDPFHPAGFKGTWAFSDHSKIPDVFHEFLQRYYGVYRIRRVPIDQINKLLNELWEGPGSLEKIFRMQDDLRKSGKDVKFTAADVAAIKVKEVEEDDDDFEFDLPLDLEISEPEDE